jgi:hypothetical protein
MNPNKFLTAALAVAALSGASARAQFNYQNGDLLAGFGNGGTTDVVVDLGSLANFQAGVPNSWNLSSALNATFGSVSGSVYWAVLGVNDTTQSSFNSSVTQTSPYTVWSSLARSNPNVQNGTPNVSGNANSQHLALNQIDTIVNLTSPSAAPGSIVDYAPGVEQVSTSLGGFSSLMNPASDPLVGNLGGTWAYNMLNSGAGTSDFYQNNPGNPLFTAANYEGDFSLSSGGVLTFNPVPEPSSWAMLGGGLLALIALRRRK